MLICIADVILLNFSAVQGIAGNICINGAFELIVRCV